MESTIPRVVCPSKCGVYIEVLLYTYDKVLIRGKNERDNGAFLFAYLDVKAQASYRAKVFRSLHFKRGRR